MAAQLAPPADLMAPPNDITTFDGQPPTDLMTPPPDLQAAPPSVAPSPPSRSKMPSTRDALGHGMWEGARDVGETAGVARQGDADLPEAKPYGWEDIKHPFDSALPKTAFRLGKSSPVLAAGVAGGMAGGRAGSWGALAGGSAGAAAGAVLKSYGPMLRQELAKTPKDPDGAFDRTWKKVGIDAAATGVSWAAFGAVNPFKNQIKNGVFQVLGIQPAIGMTSTAAGNVVEGQPVATGLGQAYVDSAVGTAVLLVGQRLIAGMRPIPKSAAEPPPDLQGGPEVVPPGTGPKAGPNGPIPRKEPGVGPQAAPAAEAPKTGWQARRPGESTKSWRERTAKADVVDVAEDGTVPEAARPPEPTGAPKQLTGPKGERPYSKDDALAEATQAFYEEKISGNDLTWISNNLKFGMMMPEQARDIVQGKFKAPPTPAPKAPEEPGFRVSAGAIAAEHAAEVSTLEAEGTVAAAPKPKAEVVPTQRGDEFTMESVVPESGDFHNATNVLRYLGEPPPQYVGQHLAKYLKDTGGINLKDGSGELTQEGQVIRQILKDTHAPLRGIVSRSKFRAPEDVLRQMQQDGWFGPVPEYRQRNLETGSYPGDDIGDLYNMLERVARGEEVWRPGDDTVAQEETHRATMQEDLDRAGITAADDAQAQHEKLAKFYAYERLHEKEEPYGEEPKGGEEVDDEGLLQGFMGHTEHSAKQLAAAREALGHGLKMAKVAQRPPGGMFEKLPGEEGDDLFPQKSIFGTPEAPPAPKEVGRLYVARRLPNGEIVKGTAAQIHPDLYPRNELFKLKPGQYESETGFVTPDGKFLDRVEARDWVKENQPGVERINKQIVDEHRGSRGEIDEGHLTGEPYRLANDIFADGHETLPTMQQGSAHDPHGVREIMDKGRGLDMVLRHLAKNHDDPQMQKLAKALNGLIGDNTVLRYMTPAEMTDPSQPERTGFYDPNTNEIVLHPTEGGNTSYTILHEGIHAATAHAIFAETPAGKELIGLHSQYKALTGPSDAYGLSSPHEFVAEALSNKDFQDTLRNTVPSGKVSMWDRLKNIVKRIIGLPVKDAVDKLLEKIMRVVPRTAEEGRAEREAGAEGFAQQNAKASKDEIVERGGGEGGNGPPSGGGAEAPVPAPKPEQSVSEWLTQHEDELYRLMQNNKVDKIDALQALWKLPKGHPLRDTPTAAKMFHHGEEEGKFAHETRDHMLTPEEQAVFDRFVQPLREMANQEYNVVKTQLTPGQRRQLNPDNLSGYMHRIVKGKGSEYDPNEGPGERSDPITGRGGVGRGLGRKTDSLFARSPKWMAVGVDGSKKFIVGETFQDDRVGRNGKPTDSEAKEGAVYKDNKAPGGNRMLRPATVEEIEQNTNLRYHKNALINTMDNLLKLRRVSRNLSYLNVLKADPVFVENTVTVAAGEQPPKGWRETKVPQLRGTYMNPRMANMFDDFYDTGNSHHDLVNMLTAVNGAMVRMIFANPVSAFMGHGANVAVHTVAQRGLMNFDPKTWPKSAKNFAGAWAEVNKMGPIYKELLRQGMAGQFASQYTRDFHATATKMMQGEMERNPKEWADIAKIVGTSPKMIYDKLSDVSSKGLWFISDVLLTSHVLDQMEQKNLSVRAAIREAEKGIPNYRIPTEMWEGTSGRVASQLMSNPLLSVFGRYHYGIMRAYAYTLKNALAKEGQSLEPPPQTRIEHQPRIDLPWGEGEAPSPPPSLPKGEGATKVKESKWERRALAAAQMLAIAAVMQVVYPALDEAVKWATKNKHASIRRAGAAGLPSAFQSWYNEAWRHAKTSNDFKDLKSILNVVWALPPLTQYLLSMAFNSNPISGKHIYNPKGDLPEIAQEVGGYTLSSPFLGQEATEWASGKKTWPQIVAQMLGISSPTAAQFALQRHYAMQDEKADTRAFKKRRAARIRNFEKKVDGLTGWVSRMVGGK